MSEHGRGHHVLVWLCAIHVLKATNYAVQQRHTNKQYKKKNLREISYRKLLNENSKHSGSWHMCTELKEICENSSACPLAVCFSLYLILLWWMRSCINPPGHPSSPAQPKSSFFLSQRDVSTSVPCKWTKYWDVLLLLALLLFLSDNLSRDVTPGSPEDLLHLHSRPESDAGEDLTADWLKPSSCQSCLRCTTDSWVP